MRTLYPEIAASGSFMLKVDEPHSLYVEECGNKDGIPVIFLHGGPGQGSNARHRRYFDPARYRIVIFDQRGCNRSTPPGEILNNTTPLLLQDMEAIRQRLGIDRWLVYGGSWGATLALLYAQQYPDRTLGMILRGTFLARQRDLDWLVKDGDNRFFPDAWQDFIAPIPEAERGDIVAAYYRRMQGDDEQQRQRTAAAWARWTGRIVTWLFPEPAAGAEMHAPVHEVAIETHYAWHRYFMKENQILDNANKLPRVPVTIIHGRRDLTCTVDASYELHAAVPGSELQILHEGGHLASEPVMTDALVRATDAMAERLA